MPTLTDALPAQYRGGRFLFSLTAALAPGATVALALPLPTATKTYRLWKYLHNSLGSSSAGNVYTRAAIHDAPNVASATAANRVAIFTAIMQVARGSSSFIVTPPAHVFKEGIVVAWTNTDTVNSVSAGSELFVMLGLELLEWTLASTCVEDGS